MHALSQVLARFRGNVGGLENGRPLLVARAGAAPWSRLAMEMQDAAVPIRFTNRTAAGLPDPAHQAAQAKARVAALIAHSLHAGITAYLGW